MNAEIEKKYLIRRRAVNGIKLHAFNEGIRRRY